jgi:serine/threonine protein kinase
MNEPLAKQMIRQIAFAIHKLYINGLSHNRLNLESIVHNEMGQVFVNYFKSSKEALSEREKTLNIHFYPPEMLLSKNCYESHKNDIWALGCITL